MQRYTYVPDFDPPREAGEFYCSGCLCRRVFWVVEGHEYNEQADLECSSCGFKYTTIRNEKTGEVKHQLSEEIRKKALEDLISKRKGELLRAGYVKEDVDRVYSSSE